LERRHGGVLNVASVASFVPGPGMAVYYASKAFVLSFTEALAGEVAGIGVKVMALCPGPTETNFGRVARVNGARQVRIARMTASEVAIQGHRAFRNGHMVDISGWKNRLLVLLIRLTPRLLVRRITGRFNGLQDFPLHSGGVTKERHKGIHWLWFVIVLPLVAWFILHWLPIVLQSQSDKAA